MPARQALPQFPALQVRAGFFDKGEWDEDRLSIAPGGGTRVGGVDTCQPCDYACVHAHGFTRGGRAGVPVGADRAAFLDYGAEDGEAANCRASGWFAGGYAQNRGGNLGF